MEKERKKLQRVIDLISIAMAAAVIIFTILNYNKLPENIPMHFGLNGDFDSFAAGRSRIFIYIGIGIVMFLMTSVLSLYPKFTVERFIRIKVRITEENREKQYALAKIFMKILGLEVIMLFGYMQYAITNATINNLNTIGTSYLISLAIIILSIIVYSIRSTKLK